MRFDTVYLTLPEQTNVTETDTKLCNINSEDLQQIFESSEEAQIETTVEPTSVDRGEANKQEPNSLSPAEPYLYPFSRVV